MAITKQDIESELSYAYLHAVASQAGFVCEVSGRLSDKQGIDARLGVYEVFPNGILTDFSIQVQLKATVKTPAINDAGVWVAKFWFALPGKAWEDTAHFSKSRNGAPKFLW